MTSRRRVATTIAGIVLAIGLAGCGGDDEAEQTDSGTTTGTTTGESTTDTTPPATMDPGMDHSKMTDEEMPGMDHSGGGH